jgi:hypothetical protein
MTTFTPYIDMGLGANIDFANSVIKASVVNACVANNVTKVRFAFITGNASNPSYAQNPSNLVYINSINAFKNANIQYVLSFGGANGKFFIDQLTDFTNMLGPITNTNFAGLDFDMEQGITQQQQDSLLQNIKAYQVANPNVPISFTLPVLASAIPQQPDPASVAPYNLYQTLGLPKTTFGGINALGVVIQIINLGIDFYCNPMVMDFGNTVNDAIVNSQGTVPMGLCCNTSLDNVVKQFVGLYAINGTPKSATDIYSKMQATYMLGVNDTVTNIFQLSDVPIFCQHALNSRLNNIGYWEISRDNSAKSGVAQTDYQFMHDTQVNLGAL